jgi:AAA+ superfamily predicted ATPase
MGSVFSDFSKRDDTDDTAAKDGFVSAPHQEHCATSLSVKTCRPSFNVNYAGSKIACVHTDFFPLAREALAGDLRFKLLHSKSVPADEPSVDFSASSKQIEALKVYGKKKPYIDVEFFCHPDELSRVTKIIASISFLYTGSEVEYNRSGCPVLDSQSLRQLILKQLGTELIYSNSTIEINWQMRPNDFSSLLFFKVHVEKLLVVDSANVGGAGRRPVEPSAEPPVWVYALEAGYSTPDTVIELTPHAKLLRLSETPTALSDIVTVDDFMTITEKVAGMDDVVAKIYEDMILPRKHGAKLSHMNSLPPLGGVLVGPPGVGKTVLAELIAKSLRGKYMFVRGPELKTSLVGQTESHIRKLFEPARKDYELYGYRAQLYFILVDELEALCPKRNLLSGAGSSHDQSMTSQFLSSTTGGGVPPNVIILGTTNSLALVDEAALRSGRLGFVYAIPKPGKLEREKIVKLFLANHLPSTFDFGQLAGRIGGLTGADINQVATALKVKMLEKELSLATDQRSGLLNDKDVTAAFLAKKAAVDKFSFHVWHESLARFADTVTSRFEQLVPGKIANYFVKGSGIFSFARYIATLINAKAFYGPPPDDFEDGIIVMPEFLYTENTSAAGYSIVKRAKERGKKVIVFWICDDVFPHNKSNSELFDMPQIENRITCEDLCQRFSLPSPHPDFIFPCYFSKLF